MTTQTQTNISSELEALRKRIAQLERRVTRLEEERDEARQTAVVQAMAQNIHANNLYRHRGHYLRSDAIRDIRLGRLTLEQAIADRNQRWPIFDDKTTLGEAYRMVA